MPAPYHAARIAAGLAEQGVDFGAEEVFPADINMDLMDGIDFRKGCFVGQEVASRMKRRGTARRRTLKVSFAGTLTAPAPILAADFEIGLLTSFSGGEGLARVRIDRLAEAKAAGDSHHGEWRAAHFRSAGLAGRRTHRARRGQGSPCLRKPRPDEEARRHSLRLGSGARRRSIAAITTRNGACPSATAARSGRNSSSTGIRPGLSWITILRKRETMREEFDGFEPEKVARWTQKRIDRAMKNPGIIRSPIKIAATIRNAQVYLDMAERGEDFSDYVWGFVDNKPIVNKLDHWRNVQAEDAAVRTDRQGHEEARLQVLRPRHRLCRACRPWAWSTTTRFGARATRKSRSWNGTPDGGRRHVDQREGTRDAPVRQ